MILRDVKYSIYDLLIFDNRCYSFTGALLPILSFVVVWYPAGTNVSDARKALICKGFRAVRN